MTALTATPRFSPSHVSEHNLLFHWRRMLSVIRDHDMVVHGLTSPAFPVTVEINPMDFCNHNCAWCFTKSVRESDRMPVTLLQELLVDLQQNGVIAVHFAGGGESTLLRGLFPRTGDTGSLVSDLANGNPPVTLGLITNGSVLEHFDLASIVQTMTWIRFSVDAATEGRYVETHRPRGHTLAHVFSNIAALVQARGNRSYPVIGASFLFESNHEAVLKEAIAFARIMKDMGVDYIQFKPENMNRGEDATTLLHRLKGPLSEVLNGSRTYATVHEPHTQNNNSTYCWYSHFGPVVAATGDVYACCYTYGQPAFRYGNIAGIHGADFAAVWKSTRRQNLAANIEPRKCKACRHNTFNLLVERLAALSVDMQDAITRIMSGIMEHGRYDDSAVPEELVWLRPAFVHCWAVVRRGYHRLLDFPVYRPTTFVGGIKETEA